MIELMSVIAKAGDALAYLAALIPAAAFSALVAWWTAGQRLGREFRLQNQAEKITHELLMHPKWELRSFDEIQRRLGGFDDDELRKLLVQAGALRFEKTDPNDRTELWGLLSRNRSRLSDS